MIDKSNLSDEHKKLLEIYKKRNLMEELNFSAYYPTGKQDKQTEGYYKWLCLSAYMKIKELERPQGEWVEKEETPASVSYYCSNCECVGLGVEHFCSWCGADMRGKKE